MASLARPLRSLVRRLRRLRAGVPIGPRPSGAGGNDAGDGASLRRLIDPYLPRDHARQVNATDYVTVVMAAGPTPHRVMDLGCGTGSSVDLFRAVEAEVDWVGVDVGDSAEVRQRTRSDATFVTYDGLVLPFPDASFDIVYSRQVLEHVRRPEAHLREVARVLRPGGSYVGSTSQLEPYHSRSYWNFTIFGFAELVTAAGLQLVELRPGIDGVTLVLRSHFGRPAGFGRWWTSESPLNALIDDEAPAGDDIAGRNLTKLRVAGHFAFLARRPTG